MNQCVQLGDLLGWVGGIAGVSLLIVLLGIFDFWVLPRMKWLGIAREKPGC